MKITQLMLARGFGGGERLFIDLVSGLTEKGNDVLAICQKDSEAEGVLKSNANIILKSVRAFSTRDPFVWRKIASIIHKHDSDIVQSHMSRGTFLAGKACRKLRKPLVVTLHNYINLKYYKNVTKFIPATKDQADYLSQKGIPGCKIDLIPHFSHIVPVAEPSFSEKDLLVYACYGRMVTKKGFHIVLDAFKMLIKKNIRATLLIGGSGPELQKLKSQCVELGLARHVKFVGWIKDIESFLEEADIFVLPSLDEPFGIAVLEAMAMGKPIVSTKSQGPKEVLNNDNAYLSEINDINSLSNAMLLAASDKIDRTKKATQALNDYKNFYSKDVIVPKFIKLYENILADSQSST